MPTPNAVELAIRGFDSLLGLLSARSRCSDLPYDNYDNQSSPHGHSSPLPLSYEHRVVMREFEPARPRRATPIFRVHGIVRPSPVSTTNTNQPPAHVHRAEADLHFEARRPGRGPGPPPSLLIGTGRSVAIGPERSWLDSSWSPILWPRERESHC